MRLTRTQAAAAVYAAQVAEWVLDHKRPHPNDHGWPNSAEKKLALAAFDAASHVLGRDDLEGQTIGRVHLRIYNLQWLEAVALIHTGWTAGDDVYRITGARS